MPCPPEKGTEPFQKRKDGLPMSSKQQAMASFQGNNSVNKNYALHVYWTSWLPTNPGSKKFPLVTFLISPSVGLASPNHFQHRKVTVFWISVVIEEVGITLEFRTAAHHQAIRTCSMRDLHLDGSERREQKVIYTYIYYDINHKIPIVGFSMGKNIPLREGTLMASGDESWF